jgi:hypothetical protein
MLQAFFDSWPEDLHCIKHWGSSIYFKMHKLNIMTKTAILLLAVFLAGCGKLDRELASFTGRPSELCHDGVIYLQMTSGVTVTRLTEKSQRAMGRFQ